MNITTGLTMPEDFLETLVREEADECARKCAVHLDLGENAEALATARRYRDLVEAADALRDEAVPA